MQWYWYVLIIGFAVLILGLTKLVRRGKGLQQEQFMARWKDIQNMLGTPEGAKMAIVEADSLVDEALKQLRINGKTMGERLVAGRKLFSDNDALWTAHKLRNKLVHENNVRIQKNQMQDALLAFRRALRDLGAL